MAIDVGLFAVKFIVPGVAVPKGRPRVVRRRVKGTCIPMAITPDKTVIFENLVKSRADDAMRERQLTMNTEPLRVEISIGVPIPSSWNKKRQEFAKAGVIAPVSRPDLDNCAKSILDGMNGVVFRDDSQVVALSVHKLYVEDPRTIIKVFSTGQEVAR